MVFSAIACLSIAYWGFSGWLGKEPGPAGQSGRLNQCESEQGRGAYNAVPPMEFSPGSAKFSGGRVAPGPIQGALRIMEWDMRIIAQWTNPSTVVSPLTPIITNIRSLVIGSQALLASLALESEIQEAVSPEMAYVHHGKVARGETLAGIIEKYASGSGPAYVAAIARVFSPRSLQAGRPYVLATDPQTGRAIRFEYEISPSRRLVVDGDEHPRARLENVEHEVTLVPTSGVINDNLFQTVASIGESPQLALNLVKLFGSEINFVKNLREGDSFSALVEKRHHNGAFVGYGRILAATFTNRGKKFEAYLFRDGAGNAQYFNARGENLRKTLLQSPLAFTRLTSRFSHNRKHPILGQTRPHLGVDYGAPKGTPVKAVGDGVVTKRGWAGGYGNQIVIAHAAGLESMYAHLSGFARGLREGQHVSQGQIIGFVGSTGLSTGPHLDFRLRQNGAFINPEKAINPRGAPVAAVAKAEFERVMLLERALLSGQSQIADYTVDSVVPLKVSVNHARVDENTASATQRKNRRMARTRVLKTKALKITKKARARKRS